MAAQAMKAGAAVRHATYGTATVYRVGPDNATVLFDGEYVLRVFRRASLTASDHEPRPINYSLLYRSIKTRRYKYKWRTHTVRSESVIEI
jgi:hypothetical protein